VAIHPFSGSPRKDWPLAKFDELAAALPWPVEWCATSEQNLQRTPLVAVDDLAVVARWLAGARAYAGNDSGVTHLAAAVGTPVVAVFLASDPVIWAPRGQRVRWLRDPAVAQVAEAVYSV
jgi:ADP-heptose:LPS heptosyltransferase